MHRWQKLNNGTSFVPKHCPPVCLCSWTTMKNSSVYSTLPLGNDLLLHFNCSQTSLFTIISILLSRSIFMFLYIIQFEVKNVTDHILFNSAFEGLSLMNQNYYAVCLCTGCSFLELCLFPNRMGTISEWYVMQQCNFNKMLKKRSPFRAKMQYACSQVAVVNPSPWTTHVYRDEEGGRGGVNIVG